MLPAGEGNRWYPARVQVKVVYGFGFIPVFPALTPYRFVFLHP